VAGFAHSWANFSFQLKQSEDLAYGSDVWDLEREEGRPEEGRPEELKKVDQQPQQGWGGCRQMRFKGFPVFLSGFV